MRGRRYSGSYTVEAAWVSAVVILAVVTTIQAAYGLRGRVVQAMVLHEAVETARHEKGLTVQEVQTRFERTGVRLELQERGGIIDGQAAADRWEVRGISAQDNAAGTVGGGQWRFTIRER